MIGRERQRELLEGAFANVVNDRSCHLFTILGAAGVGKSRLAQEFLAGVDATVVSGRCLSYGEGISYWPVTEVVKQLVPAGESDGPARLDPRRRHRLGLAGGDRLGLSQAARGARRRAAGRGRLRRPALGRADLPRPRRARRRPEPGRADPAALHGSARAARRAARVGRRQAERHHRVARAARAGRDGRARRRARGAASSRVFATGSWRPPAATRCSSRRWSRWQPRAASEVAVPPTIQALLAARLDQLAAAERGVLERGAVEGQVFHRTAVAALADGGLGRRRARRARAQGPGPARAAAAAGRRRLPVPPPAHPRHRLRGAAEGDPGRAARALRRLARGQRARRWSSSTRSSAITSNRRTAIARSSGRSTTGPRRSPSRRRRACSRVAIMRSSAVTCLL